MELIERLRSRAEEVDVHGDFAYPSLANALRMALADDLREAAETLEKFSAPRTLANHLGGLIESGESASDQALAKAIDALWVMEGDDVEGGG